MSSVCCKIMDQNTPSQGSKFLRISRLRHIISRQGSGFLQDPLNSVSLGVSAVLNIIHWIILSSNIRAGRSNILLHYNVVYGPDLIEKSLYIYLIPLLALVLLVVNMALANKFYKKEKLAAYFLNIATIPVQLIFLTASIVLIIANA
jgi:hypothetical protein